ncbi:MAG: IS5/IS1182 family transposase, partial [Nostoc sp.]
GRKKWKRDFGYHRRSLAETTMFRFKAIFGGNLSTRKFDNQAAELLVKCRMALRKAQRLV